MRKTLALVAHDAKKDDLVQMVKAHIEELAEVNLVAATHSGKDWTASHASAKWTSWWRPANRSPSS